MKMEIIHKEPIRHRVPIIQQAPLIGATDTLHLTQEGRVDGGSVRVPLQLRDRNTDQNSLDPLLPALKEEVLQCLGGITADLVAPEPVFNLAHAPDSPVRV